MSEIAIDPARVGEGVSYIEALTGKPNLPLPGKFPAGKSIGQDRWAHVDVYSLELAASLGFGTFVNLTSSVSVQVLIRDYLYTAEIPTPADQAANNPIRSTVYGAGFRVALAVYDLDAGVNSSFGLLAAKAEVAQKRISIDIRVIGIPKGPAVPPLLVNGLDFNVESYRQLQNFSEAIAEYLKTKQAELEPQPIAMTIDPLDGQRLIDQNPGVRFAMWRILRNNSLKEALGIAKKFPEVQELLVRTVYSMIFRRPEMLRPNSHFEAQPPGQELQTIASKWLNGYQNV